MDQDSTNGPATDKRNWRERLGIGTRDMPKLSDEFKPQTATPTVALPVEKVPQPVTKLAPMAPRQAPPKADVIAPPAKQAPPPPQAALADRLRAQREAAEKLAAQRVYAARERAEAKTATEPKFDIQRSAPANPSARNGIESTAERPKFSFVDESAPAARRETGSAGERQPIFQPRQPANGLPPLVPPRPALGGDRTAAGQRGPAYSAGATPRQEPPAGYRPIDPATGYPGPSSRTGLPPLRPYVPGLSHSAASGSLPARRQKYDALKHQPDEQYGEEDDGRSAPRLARSMASRPRQAPVDGDDVFEDQLPPPRRRASAADYNAAYREAEENFEDDRRRSGGPWLLLLALLLAAIATGGIVWYYQTKIKPVAAPSATENVPVVPTPEQPAKTAAEKPADDQADTKAVSKKQIYDRIVGDQEITKGQVVPTEQQPVQPEAQQPLQTGTEQIQVPAGSQNSGGVTEEAVPLPLPPPPGDNSTGTDTQGSIDKNTVQPAAATDTSNATASTAAAEDVTSQIPAPETNSAAVETPAVPLSPDQQAATVETVPQIESIGQEPESTSGATDTETVETSKPVVEKKVATKKKPAASQETVLGSEPVVLVPPSQVTAPSQETTVAGAQTLPGTQPAEQPPVKKRQTIFDLLNANRSTTTDASTTPAPQTSVASNQTATDQTSVASTAKSTAPASQATVSGYVVQLASFRSQTEAQTEYGRLKVKYPGIIGGLPQTISQATVAGSTRYRLGLGPLASREEATKICGSLVASGERDCLVRKQ